MCVLHVNQVLSRFLLEEKLSLPGTPFYSVLLLRGGNYTEVCQTCKSSFAP